MTEPLVHTFDTEGPIDITVSTGSGRVEITLTDDPATTVEIRHAPGEGAPWTEGITNLMTWVMGDTTPDAPTLARDQTRVELTPGRLVVETPTANHLRAIPLAVTIRAPKAANLSLRTGSAPITTQGQAGRVDATTASGTIVIDTAHSPITATTNTGNVHCGAAPAGLRARTGPGEVSVKSIGAPSTIHTGAGPIWIGKAHADLTAKTGRGDITLVTATSGHMDITSGSGNLSLGIEPSTAAEIDVSSGSGHARSDLPLTSKTPTAAVPLRLRARTGSGNALVHLAGSPKEPVDEQERPTAHAPS